MTLKHESLAVLVIATLTALGGCSGPAEVSDAGTDPTDAQPPVEDADTTPPDTGLPPECDPGERRTAECGFCGTESQSCEDPGRWMATSECLGQGECAVGDVETRVGELCAAEQRICLDGCAWSDWEETRGPGSCEAGETRRAMSDTCGPGERLLEECSETCEWIEGAGTCVDACAGGPARTTPEWEREVCVPDGPFMRTRYDVPTAEIQMSAFYIDVYPVTYRRYAACVAAGVCGEPTGPATRTAPEFLDYPVQGVSRPDAIAFCAWDGGRSLVSLAQWQKAGRGPSPRLNDYPWGDELDCSVVDAGQEPCNALPGGDYRVAADPYNAFTTAAASYYGLQMMGFGTVEWLLDNVCAAGYWDSPESTMPDPVCIRPGNGSYLASQTRHEVRPLGDFSRPMESGLWRYDYAGFRCGRPG